MGQNCSSDLVLKAGNLYRIKDRPVYLFKHPFNAANADSEFHSLPVQVQPREIILLVSIEDGETLFLYKGKVYEGMSGLAMETDHFMQQVKT